MHPAAVGPASFSVERRITIKGREPNVGIDHPLGLYAGFRRREKGLNVPDRWWRDVRLVLHADCLGHVGRELFAPHFAKQFVRCVDVATADLAIDCENIANKVVTP